TRRRHSQRSVRGAVFDRELGPLAGQESVYQSRRERIAATDPVEDFQVLAQPGLMELAVAITDRAPIVDRRGPGVTQRRRHDFEIGVLAYSLLDHLFEVGHVEV